MLQTNSQGKWPTKTKQKVNNNNKTDQDALDIEPEMFLVIIKMISPTNVELPPWSLFPLVAGTILTRWLTGTD